MYRTFTSRKDASEFIKKIGVEHIISITETVNTCARSYDQNKLMCATVWYDYRLIIREDSSIGEVI